MLMERSERLLETYRFWGSEPKSGHWPGKPKCPTTLHTLHTTFGHSLNREDSTFVLADQYW
jgi:hypothetical protein